MWGMNKLLFPLELLTWWGCVPPVLPEDLVLLQGNIPKDCACASSNRIIGSGLGWGFCVTEEQGWLFLQDYTKVDYTMLMVSDSSSDLSQYSDT